VAFLSENRAPLSSLALWIGVSLSEIYLSPRIPLGMASVVFYSSLFLFALVILPLYLSLSWNVGEAAIFLGFGLIFWALNDLACGFLVPGLTTPGFGICFLLRGWYPPSFLILLRLATGSSIIVYLVLNPEIGAEPLGRPELQRSEVIWFSKASLIIIVVLLVGWLAYESISRGGFGGDVVYILSPEYQEVNEPELVYEGTLIATIQEGYVLLRRKFNQTDLRIGRIKGVSWDTDVLDKYLGREVEVLGKLSPFRPGEERSLLPGRIRPLTRKKRT